MENPISEIKDWVIAAFSRLENKLKYEAQQEIAATAISRMITLRPQNAEKGLNAALEGVKVD